MDAATESRTDRAAHQRRRPVAWPAVVPAVTTVVATAGWVLAARDGRGVPPECYTVEADRFLRFDTSHGLRTTRARFAVAEGRGEIMVGYWQDVSPGASAAVGYPAKLEYVLMSPIGDRRVVDPAGDPVPRC